MHIEIIQKLLSALAKTNSSTISDLAHSARLDRITIVKYCDRLALRGFITLHKQNPSSTRKRVSLTERGKRFNALLEGKT